MSDQYVGEIRIFGGNYAPDGWAFCNGAMLSISRNGALYAVIGNSYGGDGITTFALPNLMGAAPMNQGKGMGLSERNVGDMIGEATVTLTGPQMPSHQHQAQSQTKASSTGPNGNVWADLPDNSRLPSIYTPSVNTTMNNHTIGISGQGNPHNNRQPYLALNFIIALVGIFPPRP